MKKALLTLVAAVLAAATPTKAGNVGVEDFALSIFLPGGAPVTSDISAIWGTYSGGVFTPLLSATQSSANTGYYDPSEPELVAFLTQSDNSNIGIGANLFLSIYNVAPGLGVSTWSDTLALIVLSDPTWVAPTFTINTPSLTWELTADTQVHPVGGVSGTYNFNDGAPQITLEAVPEPSTYALLTLGGLALAGHVIRRRRRS